MTSELERASTKVLHREDHGPSRTVWVFRVGGRSPMAMGRLFVTRSEGSPLHLLHPRRRLPAGKYEMMFARYGVRWLVTLAEARDEDQTDAMLVAGRVPL